MYSVHYSQDTATLFTPLGIQRETNSQKYNFHYRHWFLSKSKRSVFITRAATEFEIEPFLNNDTLATGSI